MQVWLRREKRAFLARAATKGYAQFSYCAGAFVAGGVALAAVAEEPGCAAL
jgi:hypothetical protein